MDIFAIPTEIAPSVEPVEFEGIVHFEGTPIELINPYRFFQTDTGAGVGTSIKPVCFLETGEDDSWETRILQPLLTASGYRVSYNEEDRASAAVILSSAGANDAALDVRTVVLRDTVQAIGNQAASIYRYDRVALMSAIESKLAGAR